MSAPAVAVLTCNTVLNAHDFGHLLASGQAACAQVSLAYEDRLLRRKRLKLCDGLVVLLDLEKVTNLEHGGALALSDGRHVQIVAAPEAVLVISGPNLPRLAWHIGNRHTPCQIENDRLIILHDHVFAQMLTHLGAEVVPLTLPFTPEGGAYGHGRTFGHSHGPADHADEH
ncbi:urease accessory protein UreE [Falsihalocynthiibacter sp. S25ZX9]|uniref:urease accessory protein UreE n=1 Tax=Falsihalocynthiibacter sp. S25ZX9 TaxID=3240870 RepID=UPI0035101E3D